MDIILQFIQAHFGISHTLVLAAGVLVGHKVFAYAEANEDELLMRALALQREKLTALGATPDQIAAFDAHEALMLQKASDAVKSDETTQ